jgi:glyoxylase-like metal-dependent hydrolase (beta-lactamase superfamily II)
MIASLSLTERENKGWDKRIRSFNASDLVDLYVITTERYLIILDTGNAPEQMQDIMNTVEKDLRGRQLLVINSHQHFDHVWGNAFFVDTYPAPILGHQKALETALNHESKTYLAEEQRKKTFLANVRLVAPTLTFSEQFTVHGGDLTLFLFPTPGHSSDHISLWIPEIETLLATDTAEHPIPYAAVATPLYPITYAADDGSVRRLEQDLQSLKPKVVLPCHGGTREPQLIERNLRYFKTLREKIATKFFDAKLKPEEMPEAIGWTFEDAMRDLGLEAEGFDEMYREFHVRNIQGILKETP